MRLKKCLRIYSFYCYLYMDNKRFIKIDVDDIVGYTYGIREKLKEHGCKWSQKKRVWTITKETNLDEVSRAINEYNEGGSCDKCNSKCKKGFRICYNCFQEVIKIHIE